MLFKLSPLTILLICLFIKAAFLAFLISSQVIGLGPDEAQYWTWSQLLDIGYYSKPPAIAWQIAVGTGLFGNSELGVRFLSVVIGFLLPLAVYKLSLSCHLEKRTAFWAAIIMAFSPVGFMASFLAITDGGMVLFWTLATTSICQALSHQKPLPYYQIGAYIFFGALFKWPAFQFWLLVLAVCLWDKKYFSWHLLGGLFLSLLAFLPSLMWNSAHDFPTFKHVFYTMYGQETVDVGTTSLVKGNFKEFIGAQSLLLSPVFFFCLLFASFAFIKNWRTLNRALRFLGFSALSVLFVYAFISFFKKMQGNWADFMYPAASVLISWYACEHAKRVFKWMPIGAVSSISLIALLFAFPQPFKHNLGWPALGEALTKEGYDPNKHFLFGDKYQTASLLSFYGPSQKRAYFLNLNHLRKNQFSYWPGMEVEQLGKDGYFVVVECIKPEEMNELISRYTDSLSPYFQEVKYLGAHTLVIWKEKPLKTAFVFHGSSYNGKLPESAVTLY